MNTMSQFRREQMAKRKARSSRDQKVRAASKKINEQYAGVFQALDDAADVPAPKVRAKWFRQVLKRQKFQRRVRMVEVMWPDTQTRSRWKGPEKFWITVVYQECCQPRCYKSINPRRPTVTQLKRWGAYIHMLRKDKVKTAEVPEWLWSEFAATWIRP